MSFFSSLQEFGGAWEVESEEKLTNAEIKSIKSVSVKERESKEGDTFLVMCFLMKSGKTKSHYLSTQSDLEDGDEVDPKSVKVITLSREGDDDIYRFDGEKL